MDYIAIALRTATAAIFAVMAYGGYLHSSTTAQYALVAGLGGFACLMLATIPRMRG